MIICGVFAALATLSTPDTLRKVGRFAAGAQIITWWLNASFFATYATLHCCFTQRVDLRPPETVFRFLFSSPAHFAGECSGEDFWLTPAFPSFDRRGRELLRIAAGPFRRSHFCFSVEVPERDPTANTYPMYEWLGEEMSALLGGFYGKLVSNLGHLQAGRLLTVPSSDERPSYRYDKPPFNDRPRRPDGAEPNLTHAAPLVAKYVRVAGTDNQLPLLVRAADFYRLALETYAERPEIAFAMLISTLEVLSALRDYADEELYDEQLLADLKLISASCAEGPNIANRIRGRLYQVKRKVATLVHHTVPNAFFEQRETEMPWGFITDRDELVQRVRAAYDIRSRLLHTGNRSGLWYIEHDHQGEELGAGEPVLDDKNLVKLLTRSVNLVGLERIASTVLRTLITDWARGNRR